MKRTPELQQEAVQSITTPGLHLLQEIPFGQAYFLKFSPDGKMLAVAGQYYMPPVQDFRERYKIKVWRMPSGQPLGATKFETGDDGGFAFRPTTSLLALLSKPEGQAEQMIRLWDPETGKEAASFKGSGNACFSVRTGPFWR